MTRSEQIICELRSWLASDRPRSRPELGFYATGRMPADRVIQQHLDELLAYLAVLERTSPSEVCVEVGFFRGGTHFVWSRLFAEVISIESDHGACLAALLEFPAPTSKIVCGDATTAETVTVVDGILAGRAVDHLFIDGDYHEPAARGQFLAYGPMVRSGGVIGFHDSHHTRGGVGEFLSQLQRGAVQGWPATEVHRISLHSGEQATGISYVYSP